MYIYSNNIWMHVIHYAKRHRDANMIHVMLSLETTYMHMHVSVCMVCTMQGGMKKQWDEYYALYIMT